MTRESKAFPFCAERCRLIDLGNWLDGKYGIKSESDDDPPPEDRDGRRDRDD